MLDRTQQKLQSYFAHELQPGSDNQLHHMDGVTQITPQQCECMAEWHNKERPDLSLETGLAYGLSTIPMLDSMEQGGYGHHISIDPGQTSYWHGIALASIKELGFEKRFTWLESRSDQALVQFIREKRRVQFVFFDGLHNLDGIMTDFFLADQILDVGGLLIINDMWLPSIRTMARFISSNKENYKPTTSNHENIFVARKASDDARSWDHFAPFNSRDQDETSFFKRLFGN